MVTSVSTLDANIGEYQLYANANIGSVVTSVSTLDANIGAYQTYANIELLTKANLSGEIFTGNVQAEYLIANSNVKVGSTLSVGLPPTLDFPSSASQFVGNANTFYQLNLQNISSESRAVSEFRATADNGTLDNNYVSVGLTNSTFSGNFTVPAGDTGIPSFPNDGYLITIGGNAAILSDGNIFFVANTSTAGLIKDGDFFISSNLSVTSGISAFTVQASGNITAGNINTTGQIDYVMGNSIHWNPEVSTVSAALDQIAARLYALENP